MVVNYFDKQFELRYFEMNEFGIASPTTILTLLEETAAEHCYSIDHSLYQLEKENIGWVLISGIMQMERYPNYKEKITIRTWLSKYSTINGFRENIIYDAQGNIIGRAKGLWIFFDIERRRPAQIFDEIKEKWSSCTEESIDYYYYLYSIDGRFIAEAHYNQTIVSLTKNDAMDTKDKSFIHTIKIEGTDKVCATAKSTWKKIETQTHNNT